MLQEGQKVKFMDRFGKFTTGTLLAKGSIRVRDGFADQMWTVKPSGKVPVVIAEWQISQKGSLGVAVKGGK